jgi:hypothetical protein
MRTNDLNPSLQPAGVRFPMHIYEVRPRKDNHGVDLISDVLPLGRLWYGRCEPPLLNLVVSPTTTVEQ